MDVQEPDGTTMYSLAFEGLEEMARHRAGFFAIAAVEGGLAAAGLVFGKIHCIAEPLQHVGHRHADLGKS